MFLKLISFLIVLTFLSQNKCQRKKTSFLRHFDTKYTAHDDKLSYIFIKVWQKEIYF